MRRKIRFQDNGEQQMLQFTDPCQLISVTSVSTLLQTVGQWVLSIQQDLQKDGRSVAVDVLEEVLRQKFKNSTSGA